jgi:hypothetical protein
MSWIITVFNFMVWVFLCINGITGYLEIKSQHVAGYPNAGQAITYLGLPGGVFAISTFLTIVAYKKPDFRVAIGVLSSALLLATLPYLIISRGGV